MEVRRLGRLFAMKTDDDVQDVRAVALAPRLDAFQRRRRWAAFPLAVIYKFVDDQGTYLAALITYYAFVSLFPLLLLLVTALGFALRDNPELQERVLHSALRQFPVIGDQIGTNIHSLRGNGWGIAVGLVGSLYGALGVAQAARNALDKIWAVPRHRRPNPIRARLYSLLLISALAVGVALSTVLTGTATGNGPDVGVVSGIVPSVAAAVASTALNAVMILTAYRLLTDRSVALRPLAHAAIVAACVWQGLLWAAAYYVDHLLRGSTATYGLFAIVLGLITWIYLGALVFVWAAEAVSVRVNRLWPRSLLAPFTDHARLSAADRRAYESYAVTETYKSFERVDVAFEDPAE
ncbi:YihY/virulence factor BrkB family protein [Embleya sp. NPDC050493]|uniref:YihY/virulence factor BrkB family protein n=1 Tax=Embleya sp. NPDC050493 TaxID=3363989 RepID=UPI00379ED6A3